MVKIQLDKDNSGAILGEMAKRVWPNNETMQCKWIAAVAKARLSPKGWLNDVAGNGVLRNITKGIEHA